MDTNSTYDPNSNIDKDDEKNQGTSRRKFMKNLGLLGAGAVTGAAALYSGHLFEEKKEKSGESKVLLTQDNKLVEVDSLEMKYIQKAPEEKLQERGREGIPGKRWVMVVDLARCRNARRCVAACQSAHQLRPDQYHMNTLQLQDSPDTAPYNMPRNC